MNALYAEIDRRTKPLLGTHYTDADAADAAVVSAAPVKALTKAGGWDYLATLGLVRGAETSAPTIGASECPTGLRHRVA